MKKMNRSISIRITEKDVNRLEGVRAKHGFTSNYQIMKYLMECFLRAADPENDDNKVPLAKEVKAMFSLTKE